MSGPHSPTTSRRLRGRRRGHHQQTRQQRDNARLRGRDGKGWGDPGTDPEPGRRDCCRDGLLTSRPGQARAVAQQMNADEGCWSSRSCPSTGGGIPKTVGKRSTRYSRRMRAGDAGTAWYRRQDHGGAVRRCRREHPRSPPAPTQPKLGELMGWPSTSTVCAAEGHRNHRQRSFSTGEVEQLAAIFGVSPSQLMSRCANCSGSPPAGFACLACGAIPDSDHPAASTLPDPVQHSHLAARG